MFRLLAPRSRTIEQDSVRLQLPDGSDVEVQRLRHPRARRIRLSVDHRGARLTLPWRASRVAGERFLAEHADWLQVQLRVHAEPGPMPALRQLQMLPLRAVGLPLAHAVGRFTRVLRDGDGLVLVAPEQASDAALRRALRDFYEQEGRSDLAHWLPRHLPGLPRTPSRIRFRTMSSQWGSMSRNAAMSLDLALVLARPAAFEYVLVHELCHLIRCDHSPAFWREVESRWPAWREERTYFRAEGPRLKATARHLLGA
ncbi:MAG TPA: SprT family zinc-dependent metalloprotease [Xanthomonadaceae bacterium]|nr:SprT family zinc-dependent metalloprotease [Xanthomonadaceae bacterium]